MDKNVDGNEYFLNRYMSRLEKEEGTLDSTRDDLEVEEWSGDSLLDELEGLGFSEGLKKLSVLNSEHPQAGFDVGKGIAFINVTKKVGMDELRYISELASTFYGNLGYWYDTKWLATRGSEDEILYNALSFLKDVIADEPVVDVEDFVDVCMVGEELNQLVSELPREQMLKANILLGSVRKESAIKGLTNSQLTESSVLKTSPNMVSKVLLANTRMVGRSKKKLQVNNRTYASGIKVLGLAEYYPDEKQMHASNYAGVYGIYKKPSKSQRFSPIAMKFIELLTERGARDKTFDYKWYTFDKEMLVIAYMEGFWVVIGTHVSVFKDEESKSTLVFKKSVNEIPYKDLQKIVSMGN